MKVKQLKNKRNVLQRLHCKIFSYSPNVIVTCILYRFRMWWSDVCRGTLVSFLPSEILRMNVPTMYTYWLYVVQRYTCFCTTIRRYFRENLMFPDKPRNSNSQKHERWYRWLMDKCFRWAKTQVLPMVCPRIRLLHSASRCLHLQTALFISCFADPRNSPLNICIFRGCVHVQYNAVEVPWLGGKVRRTTDSCEGRLEHEISYFRVRGRKPPPGTHKFWLLVPHSLIRSSFLFGRTCALINTLTALEQPYQKRFIVFLGC